MTDQQGHEIGFWRGLVEKNGTGYRDFRVSEYEAKTKYFSPYWDERGSKGGIDVGCGCISVFDGIADSVLAFDPLWMEYERWANVYVRKIHVCGDAENLEGIPGDEFSWAACINMIDHTPDHDKAIREIYRILRPGGKLFFEVHFDDALSPAHYGLWNLEKVVEVVDSVFGEPLQRKIVRVDEDNQSQCWAVYGKR